MGLAPLAAVRRREYFSATGICRFSQARTLGRVAVATSKAINRSIIVFALSREPTITRGFRDGTCAFSGAPRSAIINCRLCRQAVFLFKLLKAKRFAPTKRLPPSSPPVGSQYKQNSTALVLFCLWWRQRDLRL